MRTRRTRSTCNRPPSDHSFAVRRRPVQVGAERRDRALVDVIRGTELLDTSLVRDGSVVAHRHRLFLVVGEVNRRGASLALDATEYVASVCAGPSRRGPTAAHRAAAVAARSPTLGPARPVASAPRELPWVALVHLEQVDELEQLCDPRSDGVERPAGRRAAGRRRRPRRPSGWGTGSHPGTRRGVTYVLPSWRGVRGSGYLRDDGTSPFAAWFMSLDAAILRWEDYRRRRARGER